MGEVHHLPEPLCYGLDENDNICSVMWVSGNSSIEFGLDGLIEMRNLEYLCPDVMAELMIMWLSLVKPDTLNYS